MITGWHRHFLWHARRLVGGLAMYVIRRVAGLRGTAVISALFASMVLAGGLLPGAAFAGEQVGPDAFGVFSFESMLAGNETESAVRAGSHPYSYTTTIEFNHEVVREPEESLISQAGPFVFPLGEYHVYPRVIGNPKDLTVNLPPGLLADPEATPVRCTAAELNSGSDGVGCPTASAVGLITPFLQTFGSTFHAALYNMVPAPGVPAELAANVGGLGILVHIAGSVRAGGDYGLSGATFSIPQREQVYGARVTLWGDPSAAAHDEQRGVCGQSSRLIKETEGGQTAFFSCPVEETDTPLTMPTSCPGVPMATSMEVNSWQAEGTLGPIPASFPAVTGCDQLPFEPAVESRPSTAAADAPTGLDFDLRFPQPESQSTLAEAQLRDAVVTLPAGLIVNPSLAGGLQACTPGEIGLEPSSSERQAITLARPVANTFTIELKGHSTGSLASSATPAEVQAALEALPGIGAGNIQVTGAPGGWEVLFTGALAGHSVPALTGSISENAARTVSVDATGGGFNLELGGKSTSVEAKAEFAKKSEKIKISGVVGEFLAGELIVGQGIPAGTTIIAVEGDELEISKSTTEKTSGGVAVRASLAFDTNAAHLKHALETLSSIGTDNVAVAGGPIDGNELHPYTIAFTGSLAGTEVSSPLSAETSGLIGAGAGVSITAGTAGVQPLTVTISQAAGALRFSPGAPSCPEASKIGSVEVTTPLLEEHLPGAVYLASQDENPFHSLIAIYIVVDDPERGIVVKLPGHVELGEAGVSNGLQPGQIRTTVRENPQLPFEDVKLDFFEGERAPLDVTRDVRGVYDDDRPDALELAAEARRDAIERTVRDQRRLL